MSQQDHPVGDDGTEVHRVSSGADAKPDVSTDDDTEGHRVRLLARDEATDDDDTEGHRVRLLARDEATDDDDDTEGHSFR